MNEPLIERYRIRLTNTGESFICRADENVLRGMEVLARKGIPVGCRNGGCGVCKVRIVEGDYLLKKMSRAVVTKEEEGAGFALACKLMPCSDLEVEVVGKMVKSVEAALCNRIALTDPVQHSFRENKET